ncbi:MAG TPA: class I SAM-dependent methyltransferase [Candidatus Binatia bacterium]|nr:class I SAM-dependent methyltransferase [Candidatus Binatia bacterium]
MSHERAPYIPAAGHDLLLPLYDPVLRLLMRERVFRTRFLEQADIHSGHRVLDLGCGTGTMAVLIRQQRPESVVVGVDGDPRALERARRKAAQASLPIQFDQAFADRLPYPDRSFDRVVSSLVFHHLTHDDKLAALREILRVLKPGGWFHLADFGPPVGRYATLLVQLTNPNERLRENLGGKLRQLCSDAGFTSVQDRGHHNTLFGTLTLLAASAAS